MIFKESFCVPSTSDYCFLVRLECLGLTTEEGFFLVEGYAPYAHHKIEDEDGLRCCLQDHLSMKR